MHPNSLHHCECYASELILIKPTATIAILSTASHSGVAGTPGGRLKISPEHRTFRVSRGFTPYPQNSKVVSQSRPRPPVLYIRLAFIAHSKEISGSHGGRTKKTSTICDVKPCTNIKICRLFGGNGRLLIRGTSVRLEHKAETARYYKILISL
jgi:hypothetical protein